MNHLKLIPETFDNMVPIIKIVISVIVGFLVVLFIQAQFKGNHDIDRYIADANRFKEEAQLAVAFVDSLKIEVELREIEASQAIERAELFGQQVRTLRNQTTELRKQADVVIAEALPLAEMSKDELIIYTEQVIPQQQEIINQQEVIINTQAEQIDELVMALVYKDVSILLLSQSNDSLRFVLTNPPMPPPNPNKFLGINLPSRTTSFIVGALTATAAITVITK
jgi:hypothetical protein